MYGTYAKEIKESELNLFLLAEKNNLTPKLISYTKIKADNKSTSYHESIHPSLKTHGEVFNEDQLQQVGVDCARFLLIMESFPETIYDIMQDHHRMKEGVQLLERCKFLVRKLHGLDILHGDLSEENIVYNKATDQLALIDFGLSKIISTISKDEVEECIDDLFEGIKYAGPPSEEVEYILRVELGILDFLKNVYNV